MKRITASSFLILAYTLILAHAVVPHHHHPKQICFERSYSITDALLHNNNQAEDDHRHDSKNYSTSCFLIEFIPTPSNNTYRIVSCQNSDDDLDHNLQFILYTIKSETEAQLFKGSSIIQGFTPLCFSAIFSLPGLRSPPVA